MNGLDKDTTYLFELCTSANIIVTQYSKDLLFLIGARNTNNVSAGVFGVGASEADIVSQDTLNAVCASFQCDNVRRPHVLMNDCRTIAEAQAWIEESASQAKFGKVPEGFVVYWRGIPYAKLKNKVYSDHHGIVTGNLLSNRNIVIERYFAGSLDDVWDSLAPPLVEFIDELRGKVRKMTEVVHALKDALLLAAPEILEPDVPGRVYAKAVGTHIDQQFRGFFFSAKTHVVGSDEEADDFGESIELFVHPHLSSLFLPLHRRCISDLVEKDELERIHQALAIDQSESDSG